MTNKSTAFKEMSRHIVTLAKWLPLEIRTKNHLFREFEELENSVSRILFKISNFSQNIKKKSNSKIFHHLIEHELDFQVCICYLYCCFFFLTSIRPNNDQIEYRNDSVVVQISKLVFQRKTNTYLSQKLSYWQ